MALTGPELLAKAKTLENASRASAAVACGYVRTTGTGQGSPDTLKFLAAMLEANGFDFAGTGRRRPRELSNIIKTAGNGTVTVAKGYLADLAPAPDDTYEVSTDPKAGTLTLTLVSA